MADSPLSNAEGVVRISVLSGGQPISDASMLISVHVKRGVNTIPGARLVLADGDMASNEWPLSDGARFVPGAELCIRAGYGDIEHTLFEGVVVKTGVNIDGENQSRLTVECRDKAVRMTTGCKSASHAGMTDGAVIRSLAEAYGLPVRVDDTAVVHEDLVQYFCTDWDFLIARAEASGLLVIAQDGTLSARAPDVSAVPVLSVAWGVDLMDFQAEMDARSQFAAVQAVAWDPGSQSVLQGSLVASATLNAQGNLGSGDLARALGGQAIRLQTAASPGLEALDQWSRTRQLRSGLARIRGRMKFQGSAKAVPGTLIEVAGVGQRYNGNVFVSAVEHAILDGSWTTEVEFGIAPEGFGERSGVATPAATGWPQGVDGLHIGKVLELRTDPTGGQRVRLDLPLLQDGPRGVWARLAQPHASNGFGTCFLPEVGDEVVVGFFGNDASHPVVLGSLYSSHRAPPYPLCAEGGIKAIVTRCRARIEIDETQETITISTPAGREIVVSDKRESIRLQDGQRNKVELHPQGVSIESAKDIRITAGGTVTISAGGAIDLGAQADVSAQGLNVSCTAKASFSAQGGASAELAADGQTTVKGALVLIN